MEEIWKLILIIVISYLVGAFPTAIFISKRFFGFDIRQKGSGNMGSTNAFRILGWKWGVAVQLIDILKGVIAVLIASVFIGANLKFPTAPFLENITVLGFIAGITAVLGHIYSCFAGFRGGKGMNTTLGMLFGIVPIDSTVAVLFFIITVIFSGYISLGSIAGSIGLPLSLLFRHNMLNVEISGYGILIYLALGLMVLLIFAHRQNIVRLIKGNENKFEKLHLIKIGSKTKTINKNGE
ncbi:MAG: acyl phosphate:glycerol-3-phosphate acyltransferase [Bacteroidota bacterium]|nr:acyl phosphate:glycerol-3-phosphate acyltransferase [Bacteroidota bacterium]